MRGIPGGSPHKGQWRVALMISLIYAWTNGWAYNWDAGCSRRHCAHYDVPVMPNIEMNVTYSKSCGTYNWLNQLVTSSWSIRLLLKREHIVYIHNQKSYTHLTWKFWDSISIRPALQNIVTNAHDALCVTFWVQYIFDNSGTALLNTHEHFISIQDT